ncbi:hypothetical protein [Burkholderia gladioli]|uniref:hypothetical protein n=1 Tax=Burkholderia gladioli TaxID=28095 RepID=UPI00163F6D50|nr:hypothetical protein [Burkholderia gladioli]
MTILHPLLAKVAFVDIEALLRERLAATYAPHKLQDADDLPDDLWNDDLQCRLLATDVNDITGVVTLTLGKDNTADFTGAVKLATELHPDAVLILCITQGRPDYAYARTVDGGWKALGKLR